MDRITVKRGRTVMNLDVVTTATRVELYRHDVRVSLAGVKDPKDFDKDVLLGIALRYV